MKKRVKDILIIILGNFVLALSVNYFVLPYDILSGGVAGIAIIFKALFGFNTTIVIDIAVIVTFILGYIFLGKEFSAKTLLSSIVYPIFISVLSYFPYKIEANPILMSIFGGVLAGLGIGIVFKVDASTGGTDVPPLIVHKYTGISIPVLMFTLDGILTLAGLVAYGPEDVMIGIIYIFISNYVIDKIIVPQSNAVSLMIISNEKDKICEYIHVKLDRGTTILHGKGGYTNQEKEVIMTVVSTVQYNLLAKEITNIDPYAFVIVSDAKDIKGEGFSFPVRV